MSVCRPLPQMFVFGGQDSASLLNDTWVFSRNTNQWSLISTDMGTPPSPRMGATFCSLVSLCPFRAKGCSGHPATGQCRRGLPAFLHLAR